MVESSKRRQNQEEDRLSSLPDELLNNILSLIPTKKAVQTSVLSKRWRNNWKHLSVVDFSDESFISEEDDMFRRPLERFDYFAGFVNSVFSLRRSPIRKMRMWCVKSHYNNINCNYSFDTWVPSVFGSELEELDIKVYSTAGYNFKIPASINICTKLASLSLVGSIEIDQRLLRAISLPSLKALKIDIKNVAIKTMNKVLLCCPNLETLEGYIDYNDYDKVHVPQKLKRLKINTNIGDICGSIEIKCLEFGFLNSIDYGNLQTLGKASIKVFCYPQVTSLIRPLSVLFKVLSKIMHITLSPSTTKWLISGLGDLPSLKFGHLLHLELILPWFDPNFLLNLLQKCDTLQVLKIQNVKEGNSLSRLMSQPIVSNRIATQPSVPTCVATKLNLIEFKGCEGSLEEVRFFQYILQNGVVLQKMILSDANQYMEDEVLKCVPRACKCQLIFGPQRY